MQAPSLAEGELPAQTFGYGSMRFTVEAALRGPTIDALQLPALGYGDWVVVVLHAENWTDAAASVALPDFQLFASGSAGPQYVVADPTSGAIASMLGFDPATGPTETVTLEPGADQRMALLYVVASDSTVVELMAGQRAVDLAEAFGRAVDVTDLGPASAAPTVVEAVVSDVIDGQTIEVTVDGVRSRVRYVGVAAPTGDACFATESTAANAALVQGQTVWLERERRNRSGKTTLWRDVWVADGVGGRTLAAAALAAQGAVTVDTVEPEIRYAGWITASAGTAQYNGLGLWGACAAAQTTASTSVGVDETTIAPTDTSGEQPLIQPAAQIGGARLE